MKHKRLTSTARRLRRDQTDAERNLWARLRNRQMENAKFRRQVPIGGRVADFACLALKLVIELDGSQHADNSRDLERTEIIESDGFTVLRFWNSDVMGNLEGVLESVRNTILSIRSVGTPHPNPLPLGEGFDGAAQ
ncbi:MAG: DUF559 domain-containing protein [Sphingomonadales bacterium]|nr:DUF559 domain-containing protein [Sphingomonadales bacterium]